MIQINDTDISNWLHEPFTQATLEKIRNHMHAAAFERLLKASKVSTDPKVAHAHAQFEAAVNLELLFSKGELKE